MAQTFLYYEPRARAFSSATLTVSPNATLTFYLSGTTTLTPIYSTNSTSGAQLANPLTADGAGLFPTIYLDPSITYRVLLKTSTGTTLEDNDPVQLPASGASQVPPYFAITQQEINASITPTTYIYPAYDLRRYGIIVDGSTDQTTPITNLMGSFGSTAQRVIFYCPEGCKFNLATVYAAIPVGCKFTDDSQINTGQPPGYNNKYSTVASKDSSADDSLSMIASGHHPALLLNNLGTAGTSSATNRFSSVLHGAGFDKFLNPILGFQELHAASSGSWRWSLILQTPFGVATKVKPWAVGAVFAAGSYCQTTSTHIYQTAAGGTAGLGPEPSGLTGPYSDSGITDWTFVQSAIALGTTRFYVDENGNLFTQGPNDGVTNPSWTGGNGGQSWQLSYSPSGQHDLLLRDVSRSKDVFRVTDNKGLQTSMVPSINWTTNATGGNTPTVTTQGLFLGQSGATNVTGFVLPGTQSDGLIYVWFSDGNSTLKASSMILKGGVDVTPTINQKMVFVKVAAISSQWQEVSRNF